MAIEEIREVVKVVVTRCGSCDQVNAYLGLGWILLAANAPGPMEESSAGTAYFCLGWPKALPSVHPPGSFHAQFGSQG